MNKVHCVHTLCMQQTCDLPRNGEKKRIIYLYLKVCPFMDVGHFSMTPSTTYIFCY
jgi:hypothetical protein